ncbi:MAG: hypothetical protein ACR2K4_07445 [Candidatus Limnocylindria bacterium]
MSHRACPAATATPRDRAVVHLSSPSSLPILLLLLALTACKTGVEIPDIVREPEVVGTVVEVSFPGAEAPAESRALHELADGQVIEIERNSAIALRGPDPQVGDLLLYGTQPDGTWFWSGPLLDDPRSGGECAEIMAPALDEGDSIVFEIGLRLPKADGFDPFEVTDGQFNDPTKGFCLNERGEVTRYRS